ncbi:hypothetical protein GZH47_01355 [Paenibacillus rhizovicinus]|uniref:Uncharacterized protein n=1 Tax=Paenibacillus rhizovicinus TaxID=2704463 RepID=A0A6C0NYR1_9BACL|nr:hypothetical protein [Paenibacillus rhizovicinus]QHW29612.1 hypothetical protein GZH47_01355 [Paenibacillus rhizovicinus]
MIAQIGAYVLIFAGWTIFKVRSFAREGNYRTAVVYGGLMGFAIVIGALQLAKVELQSFTLPFKLLFEPIGHRLLGS